MFRTLAYLPSIIPAVAAGVMWKITFNKDAGLINMIFDVFGIQRINWLGEDNIFYSLIIMLLWVLRAVN